MLRTFPHAAERELTDAVWIDLCDPTPDELEDVRLATGITPPSRAEVSEIEATSRLRVAEGRLCMSTPLFAGGSEGLRLSPVGFVLAERACITVRFAPSPAFDAAMKALPAGEGERPGPAAVFTRLLEEIVDRAADRLEMTAEQLNDISEVVFREKAGRGRLSQDTEQLRRAMTRVGRASERMAHARYILVCIGRMAHFAADRCQSWITPDVHERLNAVRADIASLEQFEESLLGRIQLVQDAANAFISIEQNEVVKVLTITSVVGIPPVLVAGIYGMNFKGMPELGWAFGYPYALVLIVVTALLPLIWFKWKGWM